jgi:hypothetical protein
MISFCQFNKEIKMKPVWKWVLGILAVLLVVALLFGIGYLGFGHRAGIVRGGDGGFPMMGGRGFSPFGGLFMGLGMLLMLTIPVGLLFVTIYGAVRLAIHHSHPAQACANCGKPVQDEWKACPHCGKKL